MKRILYALTVLLWAIPAFAQVPMTGGGLGAPVAAGGGCSQATAWLARVTVDATHQTAYTTLICDLVTDGVWAKLSIFYVLNTQNSTTALLNMISSSFPLTANGTIAFTADHGYAGSTTTNFLSSTWSETASGSLWVSTAATYGLWSKDGANGFWGAGWGSTDNSHLYPKNDQNAATAQCTLDNDGFDKTSASNATGVGLIACSRSSTTITIYRDATSLGTGTVTSPQAANATTWRTGDTGGNTSVAIAMLFAGGLLSGTDLTNLSSRYGAWNTTISGGNP